jgi:hypothetical protein
VTGRERVGPARDDPRAARAMRCTAPSWPGAARGVEGRRDRLGSPESEAEAAMPDSRAGWRRRPPEAPASALAPPRFDSGTEDERQGQLRPGSDGAC